jgi:hypothetical protein
MIKAIDLTRLRNAEFIQFCNDFTSLVNSNDPSDLSVQPQYNAMVQQVTELESLFKNALNNPITAEIEALDFRRDQAINGITGIINAYSYHFNPDYIQPALVLQNNLKVYGTGIARDNLLSETAIIKNMIIDWETKPELIDALDDLNLNSWKNELKNANEIFNDKYLARTQDYATASPDNQKSKRLEVMTAYYELRKFLDAFYVIQNSPAYQKAINELNALIDQYNTLLNGRSTATTAETESLKTENLN